MVARSGLIFLVLILSFCSNGESDTKIYGGYPIDISDAPYMAHFTFEEGDYSNGVVTFRTYECGGSIISKRFILTAGHCGFDYDFSH